MSTDHVQSLVREGGSSCFFSLLPLSNSVISAVGWNYLYHRSMVSLSRSFILPQLQHSMINATRANITPQSIRLQLFVIKWVAHLFLLNLSLYSSLLIRTLDDCVRWVDVLHL